MLVHDIHKNETRVINFQGTAPEALKEEMLQNVSELQVIQRWGQSSFLILLFSMFNLTSSIQAGLRVGVPGMLRGLHHAHSLYGR